MGTLVLTQVSDTRRFGRVEVDDEGAINLMQEKGNVSGTGWINAGIYVLSRQFIEAIPKNRPVSLERDVFPTWVGRGLYGYERRQKIPRYWSFLIPMHRLTHFLRTAFRLNSILSIDADNQPVAIFDSFAQSNCAVNEGLILAVSYMFV